VVPFRVTPGMGKYVCGEQLRITNLQQLYRTTWDEN